MDPTPHILIVCTDLIFSTKITGTAKALGQPFACARSLVKLQELLAAAQADTLLIIDLAATGLDPMEAIRLGKLKTGTKVVAFLSHVEAALSAAAREAGADHVMARSAFSARLPEILGGVAGE